MDRNSSFLRVLRPILSGFLLMATALAAPAEIRVVGSDLLGTTFARALLEFGVGNHLPLRVTLDGSLRGRAEIEAGRADLALLFLSPGERAPGAPLHLAPWVHQTVAVVVHSSTPVTHFTVGQLEGIFGATAASTYSQWGDLGLSGDWSARLIKPHAPAPSAGLVHEFFRRTALGGHEFRPGLVLHSEGGELVPRIASEPGAIALLALPPEGVAGVRVVPIASSLERTAVLPTPETVHSGEYPLRLPCQLVFRRDAAKALLPLLRFLLEDRMAEELARAGFMPLPPAVRRMQALGFEQL